MQYAEEWKITVPWGKLVLCRWGDRKGEPVLLVHGRQDSASIFKPLLDLMPKNYNYVALDMPGNGLSDPFPLVRDADLYYNFHHYAVMFDKPPVPKKPFIEFYKDMAFSYYELTKPGGPKLTRFHYLAAMEYAVESLGWAKFHFIGHSMGCEQGLFFNVIHPNRIMKMILLDAGPTIIRMQVQDPPEYQKTYYDSFYENYHWENFSRKKYTMDGAVEALKRYRDLNDPQCKELLERNFKRNPKNGLIHPIEGLGSKEQRRQFVVGQVKKPGIVSQAQAANEEPNPGEEYTNHLVQEYIREHGLDRGNEVGNSAESDTPDLAELIAHMRLNDEEGYLSWDNRLKNLAPQNYGNDYYYELFKTIPPTLFIVASDGNKNASPNPEYRRNAKELMDRMSKLDNYYKVDVEGSHDVHYTHPERVAPHIIKFMGDHFKGFSKL